MIVRESSDELTLRAEGVGTLKAYVNVHHIEKGGVTLWLFLTGMLSEEMYFSYEEMSGALGVKKPQEAQKATALWKMKAAKDVGEEYYDPDRKDKILRRNETRLALLGRAPQRPNCCVGQSPKVRGSSILRLTVGSNLLRNRGFNDLGQTVVVKGLAFFFERAGQCASTHSFHALERPREVWAAWRAPFLLDSEEAGKGAEQ